MNVDVQGPYFEVTFWKKGKPSPVLRAVASYSVAMAALNALLPIPSVEMSIGSAIHYIVADASPIWQSGQDLASAIVSAFREDK